MGSFLAELEDSSVKQVSVETAQSKLDCAVLEKLPNKTIILGVLDLGTHEVETPELVAERIRRGLAHVPAERLVLAPDCGMKYLPRDVAFGKLKAMVEGAAIGVAKSRAFDPQGSLQNAFLRMPPSTRNAAPWVPEAAGWHR